MKKILSKILIITLILIFIAEFIFANPVFAIDGVEIINSISNIMGGVVSIVFWPKRIMITGVAFLANQAIKILAEMDNEDFGQPELSGTLLTPFHIFFNECSILNVNFFDIPDASKADSVTYKIRINVSKWFYVMRLLATAILLVILIYVGIRMALASVAEEKSKYKKMLFDWICSLALIYVLQYIAIFVIYANNAIVEALKSVATQTDISGIVADIGVQAVLGIGIDSMTSVIVYALLIFQIIGYLIAYMNRMIKVGFLLIISPLISITYSIDKMGDGKSQALNRWLKEFIYTILIQPFHCVIYMTFISVAFKLIEGSTAGGLSGALTATKEYNQLANAVLAILCVKFIKDAEEMVRKIFGFEDNNKDTSLAAGLAVAAVAANKAGSIGKSARGLASKVKNNNMFKAFSKDMGALGGALKGTKMFGKMAQKASDLKQKFQDSGAGKALQAAKDAGKNAKDKVKKASDKFKKAAGNSKAIKGFKKALDKGKIALGKGKKFWNSKPVKFMRGRNSLSSALGIAAGLAHYAATDSSPFSSIAAGNAAYQSADAFLTSTASTTGSQVAEIMEQREKDRQEELNEANGEKEDLEKERNDELTNLEKTENNLEQVNEDLEEAQNDLEEIDNEPESTDDAGDENNTDISEKASSEKEQKRISALNRVQSLTQQRESLIEQRDKSIEKIDTLENSIRAKEQEIERINYDMESTKSAKGMEGYIERIQEEGDRGKYNKAKSKEYAAIETKLRTALHGAERDASFDILSDRIARQVAADSKNLDMDSILRSCLGDEVMDDSKKYNKILSAARDLKNFECESQMYNKTTFSNEMNVSTSKIAEKTFDSYKK